MYANYYYTQKCSICGIYIRLKNAVLPEVIRDHIGLLEKCQFFDQLSYAVCN